MTNFNHLRYKENCPKTLSLLYIAFPEKDHYKQKKRHLIKNVFHFLGKISTEYLFQYFQDLYHVIK